MTTDGIGPVPSGNSSPVMPSVRPLVEHSLLTVMVAFLFTFVFFYLYIRFSGMLLVWVFGRRSRFHPWTSYVAELLSMRKVFQHNQRFMTTMVSMVERTVALNLFVVLLTAVTTPSFILILVYKDIWKANQEALNQYAEYCKKLVVSPSICSSSLVQFNIQFQPGSVDSESCSIALERLSLPDITQGSAFRAVQVTSVCFILFCTLFSLMPVFKKLYYRWGFRFFARTGPSVLDEEGRDSEFALLVSGDAGNGLPVEVEWKSSV
jgi:hypothetical protein